MRTDTHAGPDDRWDASLLRDARAHFERARAIDPSNVVAAIFLSQVSAHAARRRPGRRGSGETEGDNSGRRGAWSRSAASWLAYTHPSARRGRR